MEVHQPSPPYPMSAPTREQLLLQDALARTLANPADGRRWQQLFVRFEQCAAAPARQAVLARLARQSFDGVAGFLRATLLARLSGERGHIERAAALALSIAPLDVERLHAFVAYEWGEALRDGIDRAGFVARLRQARAPELVALMGRELVAQTAAPLAPRAVERVARVALVTPFLAGAGHTPTVLALEHAALLQRAGLQVQLFAPQDQVQLEPGHYLGHPGQLVGMPPDLAWLRAALPAGVPASLSDPTFSLPERWRAMLALIGAFDPDLVLFVGLQSALLAPLYAARPVLGLCLHSTPPMAPVDVWLSAAAEHCGEGAGAAVWGAALPPAWGQHYPYRLRYRPAPARPREALGLAPGQLALVTVGARLGEEVAGPWAARMAALLARRAELVWLLVGGNGALPAALAGAPAGQLRLLPQQAGVADILAASALFLNPPRMGGGFSVAEAMAQGLPVLTLGGSDGGAKVGALAAAGLDDYFARLDAYLDDAALRARDGAALRLRFEQSLDLERAGPALLAAAELARRRYQARRAALTAPPAS